MRLVSGSLLRQWAMGACLLLLWAAATPTPTQARFIAKRETAHVVDMGVVDAQAADRDIVRAGSESASGSTTEATTSHVVKNATKVEYLLTTTTTTTTEEPEQQTAAELTTAAATTTEATTPAVISSTAAEVMLESKQQPVNSDAAETPSSSSSSVIAQAVTTTEMNELLKQSKLNSIESILQNTTTENVENVLQKFTTTMPNIKTEDQLKAEQQQITELQAEQTTTEKATTTTTPIATTTTTMATTTTRSLATTKRGEDHARSMQFPLSTENDSRFSAVTPMKLLPLPMRTTTTTTTTTTHMPQLLAPLLHIGVTAAPIASHENAIEEEQPQLQHEKRAKYISDNATNAQQLLLPNGAEVWSLAAMKMVPTSTTITTTTTTTASEATTSRSTTELANDIEQLLNRTEQHKEKNLLDWQQIMLMQTSHENRTELTMSTTLDATEAATQATTIKLDAMLGANGEMEMSASSAVTENTLNNMGTTENAQLFATDVNAKTMESITATGMKFNSEFAATELEKLRAKEIVSAYEAVPKSNSTLTENAMTNLTAMSETTELSKLSSQTESTTSEAMVTATSTAQPDLTELVKINLTAATAAANAQLKLTEPAKLNVTDAAEKAAIATATATSTTTTQPQLTELTKLNLTATTSTATALPESTEAAKLNLTAADEAGDAAVTALPALTDLKSKAAATESEITENATKAKPDTGATRMPPAALPTAEPPTTTGSSSALNGGTPNANEMAMKATAHENNEKSDKSNNVDSDDVINVSVAVSVSTEATLAAITVSTRTAGEASTTTTPTSTSRTLLDEHLAKTTAAATTTTAATIPITTLATPTPTEIVQISNEVNLETIAVETVTKDKSNKNNVQASGVNNLLISNGEAKNNSSDVNSQRQPINNSDANSEANSQRQPINNSIYSTSTTVTITTTPTSLLTDLKANSKLNEQETNNIGETETTAGTSTTTTTPTPLTAATAETTASVGSIATTETAAVAVVNALDESTATTTITAATPATAAAKGASDLHEDHDHNKGDDDDLDVDNNDEEHKQQQIEHDSVTEQQLLSTANMANETTTTEGTTRTTEAATTATTATTTETTTTTTTTTTTEEPFISLLDDSTTTTTTTARTTPTTTTTEPVYSSTSNINTNNTTTNNSNNMLPVPSSTASSAPTTVDFTTTKPSAAFNPTDVNHMQQPHGNAGTDVNVIIATTVSVIGVVALVLLVAFLYFMRKRQKQTSYGQRCRPVSLDAYSLDNVSVLGSVRRKGRDLRASKRTYGNAAFDDPSLRHNLLSAAELARFVERRSSIYEEFRDVPQISARPDEVPTGCEDKNRFANIIPLPETRVVLQRQLDDDKTEYINANYVRGPNDVPNYYIACQAPMESTTGDFWRMIWEQQSRVIVQATDLSEEGIERCAEYLPPSVTLDNHSTYGDFQVTLKHREVKDKYAISTLMLKRVDGAECRELTHYWYKWPATGVPLEEAPIIAMLLEARSSLKSYALEQANELKHEKSSTLTLKSLEGQTHQATEPDKCSTSSAASNEINGNVANKTPRSQQGPLTIHCSPGTGRTGTIIACDMAIRSLETPKRSVNIPQLVYYVRRGRAKAVQTREQYEFIYKVANMYATKITNLSNDN